MTTQKENSIIAKIWSLTQSNSGELKKISGHVAVLNSEMGGVKKDIGDIKNNYVRNETFSPVQRIAYGFVSIALLAIAGAILKLIIIG